MSYAELLKKYIKNSRYTLEEISKLLSEMGLSASREHLSRLQNGKVPPASDEINRALALITGGDADELLWHAFVDRAPEKIKSKLRLDPGVARSLLDHAQFCAICGNDNKGTFVINHLIPLSEGGQPNDPENMMVVCRNCNAMKANKNAIPRNLEKITSAMHVPVLGFIAAGAPILAEEHIQSYMTIPVDNYNDGELFVLVVKGDSMEGSRIYNGDKVVVKIQPEVENGEIAVVNVDGENATLKKVKRYDDGSWWLISTNEKYAPIPLTNERARVIGKVIQVIFEP